MARDELISFIEALTAVEQEPNVEAVEDLFVWAHTLGEAIDPFRGALYKLAQKFPTARGALVDATVAVGVTLDILSYWRNTLETTRPQDLLARAADLLGDFRPPRVEAAFHRLFSITPLAQADAFKVAVDLLMPFALFHGVDSMAEIPVAMTRWIDDLSEVRLLNLPGWDPALADRKVYKRSHSLAGVKRWFTDGTTAARVVCFIPRRTGFYWCWVLFGVGWNMRPPPVEWYQTLVNFDTDDQLRRWLRWWQRRGRGAIIEELDYGR